MNVLENVHFYFWILTRWPSVRLKSALPLGKGSWIRIYFLLSFFNRKSVFGVNIPRVPKHPSIGAGIGNRLKSARGFLRHVIGAISKSWSQGRSLAYLFSEFPGARAEMFKAHRCFSSKLIFNHFIRKFAGFLYCWNSVICEGYSSVQ